ncbi:putative Oxidoreductase [Seiridium cardinale]|uniref:Oxidoreductase n=1 Tax=Seiridium cardinale TaxID=138064 RepID=A0ABR2XM75_9PEZI
MSTRSRGVVLLGDAAHCASPMSGMGTTLAFLRSFHLAGCLSGHPNDLTAAFETCERRMRPEVDRAQKLYFGIIRLFNPERPLDLWILSTTISFLNWSGILSLLFMPRREPEDLVLIQDYGLRRLSRSRE